MGVTEEQRSSYKDIALLFRLGQAEEILDMLTNFRFKEINWKKYNFNQLPTAAKKYDGNVVLY